jgi:fumarate hydratase class II
MSNVRKETDSLGVVEVPADKLWGAQTQRSLEQFSNGKDLIPREMITAYAILKKAAAAANHADKRLGDQQYTLITQTCDEILAGRHHDMFPLHVWMTGSGTQFNMNVNEVISNRCCEIAGTPLGSKTPVHPNDHVNMSQSSNDSFPSAMNIAAAVSVKARLIPAVKQLHDAFAAKAREWKDIVKIGRTHMQDATPLTLGQEWSGYEGMLADDLDRIEDALRGVYRLALCSRHRHQFGAWLRRGRRSRDRQTHEPAVYYGAQQIYGARRPRRTCATLRHAANASCVALQDSQRHPADVLRPASGLCRTSDSRERTRLLDYARQSKPHSG